MPDTDLQVLDTGQTSWRNWHHFKYPVRRLLDLWNGDPGHSTVEGYNGATAGFQRLIAEALAAGEPLRAKGGGWSFSSIGTTEGTLLNTRPLNYRFAITPGQAHPEFMAAGGDPSNLALVQGGNSIADLNRFLEARGKSVPTSGASNGQTIAGAVSTGTHGAAIDVGAMQDFVRALHLVVSPDRSVWLEPASAPAVVDALPAAFGAELLRDDALFEAALVGLGSFGLIQGVLIEATDLFHLQAWRRSMKLDDDLWRAVDQLDLAAVELPRPGQRPHHFQLFINPFRVDDGVLVVTMYKDDAPAADCQPPPFGQFRPGDGALEVIGAITDIAPAVTPALASLLIDQLYKPYEKICGTHSEIFTDTTVRGPASSTAFGIPLGLVRPALNLVLARIQEDRIPVTVALRYVKASRATLAFTRHAPQTCVLEVDGPRSDGVLASYRRIWEEMDDAGIPYTFHWGKISDIASNPDRVRQAYGDAVDAWREARRTLIPDADLRRVFENRYIAGSGLGG